MLNAWTSSSGSSLSKFPASGQMSRVRRPLARDVYWLQPDRSLRFAGSVVQDTSHAYAAREPQLNDWSLAGKWTISGERALLNEKDGSIVYRFHARALHLVLGPSAAGGSVRFRIPIDGKEPGAAHGVDPEGRGEVTAQRLYQLVRDSGPIVDHTFEIRFLDSGVQAYAFTFG
jgi:hypothetical protein